MRSTIPLLFVALLASCTVPRALTEQYIKTEIEQHVPEQHSDIRMLSVFRQEVTLEGTYIEMTGYQYKGAMGLVIGADRYYKARKLYPTDDTKIAEPTYMILDPIQARHLYEIIDQVYALNHADQPNTQSEVMYRDFTISEDLIVSYQKLQTGLPHLSLWIDGYKYPINGVALKMGLTKFLNYGEPDYQRRPPAKH